MLDLIAFDADDTLWHTEYLYVSTRERLERLLDERYGIAAESGTVAGALRYVHGLKDAEGHDNYTLVFTEWMSSYRHVFSYNALTGKSGMVTSAAKISPSVNSSSFAPKTARTTPFPSKTTPLP